MLRTCLRYAFLGLAALNAICVLLFLMDTQYKVLDLAAQDRAWQPSLLVLSWLIPVAVCVVVTTVTTWLTISNVWCSVDAYEERIRRLEEEVKRGRKISNTHTENVMLP